MTRRPAERSSAETFYVPPFANDLMVNLSGSVGAREGKSNKGHPLSDDPSTCVLTKKIIRLKIRRALSRPPFSRIWFEKEARARQEVEVPLWIAVGATLSGGEV